MTGPGGSCSSLVDFEVFFFFFGISGKSYARGRRETKKIITVALCIQFRQFRVRKWMHNLSHVLDCFAHDVLDLCTVVLEILVSY